ncbi:hypothetical protein PMAYCL1PPCAC_05941, partial [Pristionchus mayeri]
LALLCILVCSLQAEIVHRSKRSLLGSLKFKYFKMTRRPSPSTVPPVEEMPTPDTSFVVEKPPATSRPRLTLLEKFDMDLENSSRTTAPPNFAAFQPTQGGVWDFLS